MAGTSTYAPFFESSMVIPVVDVDDEWTTAMITAIANMSELHPLGDHDLPRGGRPPLIGAVGNRP